MKSKNEADSLGDADTNKLVYGKDLDLLYTQMAEDLIKLTQQEYKDNPEFARAVDAYKANQLKIKMYVMRTFQIILLGLCFFCIFAFSQAYADCNHGYASVGAGYKFQETTKVTVNGVDYQVDHQSPYSARFELGVECEQFKFGVAHRSQWLTGAPFNDQREYSVSEVFVEYKVYLW